MNTGDNMQTDILIIHTIMHLYHICIYIKVVRNKLTIIEIDEFQNVQPVSKQQPDGNYGTQVKNEKKNEKTNIEFTLYRCAMYLINDQ